MDIKKYSRSVKCKFCSTHLIKGGIIMAVCAKPTNSLFVIKEDKIEQFFSQKSDKRKVNKILERARKFNENMRTIN